MVESSVLDEVMEKAGELHVTESSRVESFKSWPYDSESDCSINKMAEAGFYWTGTEKENDTATCFACGKVLDGWEALDNPWLEHKKHAPQCYFVKLGKPEHRLTVEEFVDLCLHVVLFSIQISKEYFQKKFKSKTDHLRDAFNTKF